MLIIVSFRQVLQLGCNSAPTFCKTHSAKLQVSVHGPIVKMFRSQISTVVISTNSSHLDVAIDHETLQPQRWVAICLIRPAPRCIAMARPAVASSLISRPALSTPSPNPFALTSTPCCCKNYSKVSHHCNATNSSSCCLDCCAEFRFSTREADNRLCC